MGRVTSPVRIFLRERRYGRGGSARFGGLLEEWNSPYRQGALLLGVSGYDPNWRVGHQDDRHHFVVAASRSGKNRSFTNNNLILWPGSALVIDPKGSNAAVTAARRGHGDSRVTACLGQDVYVIDPFAEVQGIGTSHFNPLDAIDLDAPTAVEDIRLIADALCVPQRGDSFWIDNARQILSGLIAHMVSTKDGATLGDVADVILSEKEEQDEVFEEMLQYGAEGAGGLARAAASLMMNAAPNERSGYNSTTQQQVEWLISTAMRKVLGRSDFAMRDLKARLTTIYVVIPEHLLETHSRFLRLFVNLAIWSMSLPDIPPPRHQVLFMLDEFFALGEISLLEKAAGLMAGTGMKLVPVIQQLSQIREALSAELGNFLRQRRRCDNLRAQRRRDGSLCTIAAGPRGPHRGYRRTASADCCRAARNAGARTRDGARRHAPDRDPAGPAAAAAAPGQLRPLLPQTLV